MYIHGILFSYCAHLTNASSWMYKIIRTYQSGQHCSQLILSWPFWSQRLYFRLKAWELKLYNKVKFLFSNHDCFVQELHVTWWTTMAGNSWLLTGDDNVPRAITTLLCARISAIATLDTSKQAGEKSATHWPLWTLSPSLIVEISMMLPEKSGVIDLEAMTFLLFSDAHLNVYILY